LLASLQQGTFSYDDLALRDGWTDWKPLRTLFAPPATAPPLARPAGEAATTAAEQRMWSGRPSHWNFFFSWLLALVFVGAGAFCVWIYLNGNSNPLLLIPGAIGIVILLYIYIRRARQLYLVTNRKVEIRSGLLVKSSNEIRVKDIRSINVTKHGLAGFIGIGSVEFSSAATDRAEVIFVNIAHADRVRDLVTNLQES
jgi:membrane protein YdbS with pleckstrin-like domain